MKILIKLRENKTARFIMGAFRACLTVILVVFIAAVCLQRFSNSKMSFFNYRMFTVVSGSMVPKYVIGDVIITKGVEPSEIKVGDTISYLGAAGDFRGKIITHGVENIIQNTKGDYYFRTKGLANLVADPIISASQVYGVVVYKAYILSFIYKIVSTNFGFYIFIIFSLIFIIGSEILATLLNREEKRRAKLK